MKKITLLILASLTMAIIFAFSFRQNPSPLHASGMTDAAGSPYDGGDCSGCHGGGSATPGLTITANPAFGAGNTYLPSTTYTISIKGTGYPKYGFDLEILNSTSTTTVADKGTFGTVVTSNCQKLVSAGITNLTHTAPTGSGNTATFSFRWTAPASGTAYLYCALLGANGDGGTNGDNVKASSLVLTQSATGVMENSMSDVQLSVFPNPSSDNLNLKFSLKENSSVTADLFDINGNKVAGLIAENGMAGYISRTFDISSYSKGVYFIRLNVNGKISTGKIVKL